MKLKCPLCNCEVESVSYLPFGERITCQNGHALVFDYDEGEEGPYFWLVTEERYDSTEYGRIAT